MPVKRLSDAALVLKARRAQALKEKAKEIARKQKELEEAVMKELERRKTRVLEHNGVRLTRVQSESTKVNADELLAHLTPQQRKLCQKTVFDRAGMDAAVQAGLIDVQKVARYSEVVPNNPYLVVTPVAP